MHRTPSHRPASRRLRSAPVLSAALSAILCAGLLSSVWASQASAEESINRVILRINDRIVTLYDYLEARSDARTDILRRDMPQADKERLMEEVPVRVLRALFQEALLMSRADQLEVFIDQNEINSEVEAWRDDLGLTDSSELAAALAQSGMTLEKFQRQIEKNLTMRAVIGREVNSMIDVDDDDLRRYYRENPEEFQIPEQVRAQEIVVLDAALDDAAKLAQADEIHRRLTAGESLTDLADYYAAQGLTSGVIDHEWIKPGDLDAALEEVLFDLETGRYSNPVPGRGGLHILVPLERKPAEIPPFHTVREQIELRRRSEAFNQAYGKYLTRLEKNAYIVEDVPEDASGYRNAVADTSPFIEEPFRILGEDEGPSGPTTEDSTVTAPPETGEGR